MADPVSPAKATQAELTAAGAYARRVRRQTVIAIMLLLAVIVLTGVLSILQLQNAIPR